MTGRRLRGPSLGTGGRSCAVMVARLYHFTPIVDSRGADGRESPGESGTNDPVVGWRPGPGLAGAARDGRGAGVPDGAPTSDVSLGPWRRDAAGAAHPLHLRAAPGRQSRVHRSRRGDPAAPARTAARRPGGPGEA